jgi:hypothetical protein
MATQPGDDDVENPTDRPLPAFYRATKGSGAVTVLSAAMLAVGEILEPEKAHVELVQPSHDDVGVEGLYLHFGDLPELD